MGRPAGWATAMTGRPTMRSPGRPPVNAGEVRCRFWLKIAEGLSSEEAGVACGVCVSAPLGSRWFRQGGGRGLDKPCALRHPSQEPASTGAAVTVLDQGPNGWTARPAVSCALLPAGADEPGRRLAGPARRGSCWAAAIQDGGDPVDLRGRQWHTVRSWTGAERADILRTDGHGCCTSSLSRSAKPTLTSEINSQRPRTHSGTAVDPG